MASTSVSLLQQTPWGSLLTWGLCFCPFILLLLLLLLPLLLLSVRMTFNIGDVNRPCDLFLE